MKIKFLLSLVALLFVSVLVLLYLNLQKPSPSIVSIPTPTKTVDLTSNWKTYTNANHGLSFKYPFSTWTISENNGVISLVLKNDPGFDIEITKSSTEFDISKLSTNSVQNIKLGNISAKKISYLTPNSEKQVYFTFNNNESYFTLLYKESSDSQVNQEITQILSTFKFTDSSEDLVTGLQLNKCCPCPTKISSSQIGQDGWVLHQSGKDYSSLLPKTCGQIQCQPCQNML